MQRIFLVAAVALSFALFGCADSMNAVFPNADNDLAASVGAGSSTISVREEDSADGWSVCRIDSGCYGILYFYCSDYSQYKIQIKDRDEYSSDYPADVMLYALAAPGSDYTSAALTLDYGGGTLVAGTKFDGRVCLKIVCQSSSPGGYFAVKVTDSSDSVCALYQYD